MSALLIVVLLVVIFLVASVFLGRQTYEVESARDTEYLELEGSWIRYKIIGGGPPVVLVHGWLSSSRIWERLANRLAQRFTVYTLDLNGFGESDKPLSGYGVRHGSRLLYAFCAHFGLTRASVIGHDIGGNMAVKLAADRPDIVGRLVLVAAPANEEQMDLPTFLWLATLPVVGPVFYALGRVFRPLRVLWMRAFVYEPDDLPEEVVEDAAGSTPAAVSKTLEVVRREISRGRLVRQARVLKVPILAVAGEEDQIVDPQSANSWAEGSGRAEVWLANACGHLPMIERTSAFNAQVMAFLTGDSRYLETVVEEEAYTVEEEPSEVAEEPSISEVEDDTTADLTQPLKRIREDQDDVPNIRRKRNGMYPAPDQDTTEISGDPPPKPDSDDGVGESSRPGQPPRRESGGRSSLPELPEDLFNWPEAPDEFRSRRRSGEESSRQRKEREQGEDPDTRDDPDTQDEPPRP